jgi:hypothetical protein
MTFGANFLVLFSSFVFCPFYALMLSAALRQSGIEAVE